MDPKNNMLINQKVMDRSSPTSLITCDEGTNPRVPLDSQSNSDLDDVMDESDRGGRNRNTMLGSKLSNSSRQSLQPS